MSIYLLIAAVLARRRSAIAVGRLGRVGWRRIAVLTLRAVVVSLGTNGGVGAVHTVRTAEAEDSLAHSSGAEEGHRIRRRGILGLGSRTF